MCFSLRQIWSIFIPPMLNPQPPTDSQCVHHPPILSREVNQLQLSEPLKTRACRARIPSSTSVQELSTDGECSPSNDAIAGHPAMQLRCKRDFTDGEAMCQEHLMSSEDEDLISGNEDVNLEQPWYISGEYRKVCVGGHIEHIYVRHDQVVWCGWKGEEWSNCPGAPPNRWDNTHQFRTMRIECEGETACHEEGVAGEENGVAEEENMASSVANLQHAVEAQIQW